MRILITGASGFAGLYLVESLLHSTDWNIIGVSRTPAALMDPRLSWRAVDLLDKAALSACIAAERPDKIVHLAAQSNVPVAWNDPWATYEVNIRGQLHLFQSVIDAGLTPRIVVASSQEVYGAPQPDALPLREDSELRPNNPYAVSKVAQDVMAAQYRISHQLPVVVARAFNHIGPRQSTRFVLPDFARRMAEIELGRAEPEMKLGNMAAARDFTDVRDVARAYIALLDDAVAPGVYNLCSGVARSIQSIFDQMLSITGLSVKQVTDPARFRKFDTPVSYGDNTRLRNATGWQPEIPFETTLRDVIDAARANARSTGGD
jgi:GDP-4-dehydro-6-deoxy-D-mannose reductase